MRLRHFSATRFPATAAHKHGQVLRSVREIISPPCPFPNESLSGYLYPKLSNCRRSMRKPSRPLDGRIEPGSLGLGCQHVRHQAPEKVALPDEPASAPFGLHKPCLRSNRRKTTLCGVDQEALCARWSRSLFYSWLPLFLVVRKIAFCPAPCSQRTTSRGATVSHSW